jgi:murein L,D-transpeptidase YcbB/YkuD
MTATPLKISRVERSPRRVSASAAALVIAVAITGCSGEVSELDRAQASVTTKEKAVTDAAAAATAAADAFCSASEEYIRALDVYGDVLNDSAPTVGDVRNAGADLEAPRDEAQDAAQTAVDTRQDLADAEKELAAARAELKALQSGSPAPVAVDTPTPSPTVAPATIERVTQAEEELADAQNALDDETPLTDASEVFNSAAVALEWAWLRLFADAGCLSDQDLLQAQAAMSAYTTSLQQDLATAGYYQGDVDGVYGPQTVQAVEDLQSANALPVTGAVDRATADALAAQLAAIGGAAAQVSMTTTAAVQQTLKLAGFWDGAVDGVWTPELTEAVKALQTELGVEPTGTVDAATVTAFTDALSRLPADPSPTPSPTA